MLKYYNEIASNTHIGGNFVIIVTRGHALSMGLTLPLEEDRKIYRTCSIDSGVINSCIFKKDGRY